MLEEDRAGHQYDEENSDVSRCIWCQGPLLGTVYVEQFVTCSQECRDKARDLDPEVKMLGDLIGIAVTMTSSTQPVTSPEIAGRHPFSYWLWVCEGVTVSMLEDERGNRSLSVNKVLSPWRRGIDRLPIPQSLIAGVAHNGDGFRFMCPDPEALAFNVNWFKIIAEQGPLWRIKKRMLCEWIQGTGRTPVSPLLPSSDG